MSARYKLQVDRQGRLVLPVRLRQELGLQQGGQVTIEVEGDEVRLSSSQLAVRRIQRELRKHVPEGVSLVDELIADRRLEQTRERGQ